MRTKFWVFTTIFLASLIVFEASYGQLNRKAIKKNNKNMSKYKGTKNAFTKQKQYTMVGFSLNAMNYFGDLSPLSGAVSTDISFTRPGFSIWGAHRWGPRYTVEVSYSWGTFSGSDFKSADPNDDVAVFRYIRNISFRNRVHDLTALAVIDLWDNNATYISRVQ